jgi:hypothetical protein
MRGSCDWLFLWLHVWQARVVQARAQRWMRSSPPPPWRPSASHSVASPTGKLLLCYIYVPSSSQYRLYWTSFPVPAPTPDQLNRPEQPAPTLRTKSRGAGPAPVSPEEDHTYYYFSIDDRLVYLSFFEDWGPLNLAQVYRACILIHELLQACLRARETR